MRLNVLLPLLISGALVCCGSWAFAQQTGTDKKEADAKASQSGDDDLGDLAKELDEDDKKAAAAREAKARAQASAMNSAAARRRQTAIEQRDRLMAEEGWKPTHEQANRIEIPGTLTNMCLDKQGRILACCGDKILRVLSQEGEVVENRALPFAPQAITVDHTDGTIYVAGQGKLVRMGADGEILKQTDFPLPPSKEEKAKALEDALAEVESRLKTMEESAKQNAKRANSLKKAFEEANAKLEEEPLSDEEKTKLARTNIIQLIRDHMAGLRSTPDGYMVNFKDDPNPAIQAKILEYYISRYDRPFDIEQQRELQKKYAVSRIERSMGPATYTGMAISNGDLFIICSGTGYGFDAWRTTPDFGDPKKVLSGLRGCCGQMDCQAHDGNLWLAMNTGHTVICYDRDGNELSKFGKRDAAAADGFGGCCEPKNLRFSQDGKYVYTAQSGPPVCVKRFSLEGEFQGTVCFPIFETGCVRVSVDLDGETFFMMSPNEHAVYVFKPAKP